MKRRAVAVHAATVLLLIAAGMPASAGRTDPDLFVTSVMSATVGSTVLIRFEGALLSQDLIQLSYPLQLVVWEPPPSSAYVRFDVTAGAVRGVAPELDDGMSPADALGLMGATTTPVAGAAVTRIAADGIAVTLPAGVVGGPVQGAAFAIDQGQAIVSNAVAFSIAGAAP